MFRAALFGIVVDALWRLMVSVSQRMFFCFGFFILVARMDDRWYGLMSIVSIEFVCFDFEVCDPAVMICRDDVLLA